MKYTKTSGRSEIRRAAAGQFVVPDTADRSRYGSLSSYTPARIRAIMSAANTGDIERLCICGREILERNWDVIGAMEQREDALCGCPWSIQPGDDTPEAAEAAKAFEKALKRAGRFNGLDTFYDLVTHCMSAVVMPFAASEIVWGEGGALDGFQSVDAWHFTLRDGYTPRLICDEYPLGLPEDLQRNKFVFHRFRKKSDPARAGKIRVLAWLHCFQNWPLKDLFSFIERFGMPFVVAKVDQNAWDNERAVLHGLIRNFGPNGGGVFTKSTELELLNAANTGSDNVYFHALEFTHNAIYTLLVGQLASSSDASGMSNGDAQSSVRQDILEADARAVESTVLSQIAAPWTLFRYGPDVAPPELHFEVAPPEDQAQFATVVNTLSQAGFKADAGELSERFGLKLTYEPPAAPSAGGFAMAAEKKPDADPQPSDEKDLGGALEKWLGQLASELADIAGDEDLTDKEFAERLAACTEGKKLGSSKELESLMASDMKEKFNAGNQVQRR